MMDCGDENFPGNPESCWRVPGLPDNLEDERLEQYSMNQTYPGPRDQKEPREIDRNSIRYKWKNIGVAPNQLIQLSFHDCLRYNKNLSSHEISIQALGIKRKVYKIVTKVENILKGTLVLIPSPSYLVKIQNIGGMKFA